MVGWLRLCDRSEPLSLAPFKDRGDLIHHPARVEQGGGFDPAYQLLLQEDQAAYGVIEQGWFVLRERLGAKHQIRIDVIFRECSVGVKMYGHFGTLLFCAGSRRGRESG
jgi:hypothetical protein